MLLKQMKKIDDNSTSYHTVLKYFKSGRALYISSRAEAMTQIGEGEGLKIL